MRMEAPLRRSTRCRRPTYGTGDVVEITHGSTAGGISIGRLISKIDDDSTAASPATGHDDAEAMWIVSFKESSRIAKDEVVPERAFTRVVKQANPEDDSWKKLLALSSDEHEEEGDTSTTPGAAGATPVSTGNGNGNANGSSNSSQGSAARRVGGRKSKRRASAKSASNSTVSPKVSTRASASSEDNVTTVSGYSTRQRSGKAKRKVEPPVTQQRKKRKRQSPVNSQSEEERLQAKEKYHEEVEKIKMNTGILYIYRGHNPRVSFVRKY